MRIFPESRAMIPRIAPVALAIALGTAAAAPAQQERPDPTPFGIAEILSAPFASELVPAPDGRRVAWLGYEEGRRNVWVAEAPSWRSRRLTRYASDDGQPLSALTWTADSRAILFVRGGAPGSNWDADVPVNPTSDPAGGEQAVWMVSLGGALRRLGEGHSPVPSPAGDQVVFIKKDTLWTAPLRFAGAARVMFRSRGQSARPVFSPDGRELAFVSRRGDHSFIGVYNLAGLRIRWIAPGTWRDDLPRFSPDGARIAFIRRPGLLFGGGAAQPAGGTAPPPFSIQVAETATGATLEVWRSPGGPNGNPPGLAGQWALFWADTETLLFAAELTGWLGLYRVSASGGEASRFTPGGCEIRDVRLAPEGDAVVYASNCGDADRLHVQRSLIGGEPAPVTSGDGLEWAPAPLADGRVMVLRSDALRPAAPAFSDAPEGAALEGWPLPPAFPIDQLVEPEQVVIRSADSTPVHLQVFLPAPRVSRHPAVLFLHGGPQRQMLLGWHDRGYYHNAYALNQYLASRGFIVASVNYRGGIGYGRAFREAPRRGRFGASEYADVLAAAAYLRSRPDVDSARIGLWGGSYGGYLTALGLARDSDRFAAGVDLHGVHDYAEPGRIQGLSDSAVAVARRSSPVADLERWRSPVLLIAGDDDRNVQFQQTVDLAQRLRRRGVPVEELIFPDDVHSFLRHANWVAAYQAAADFFARTLGARSASR
jgi:dipeptidyl aminopeptidase/acylaminoacyl peptidase